MDKENKQEKPLDRISYALGLSMGNNFRASGIQKIDVEDFADGVAAVFEGRKPRMTYDEAKAEIQAFFTEMEKKQQEQAAAMAPKPAPNFWTRTESVPRFVPPLPGCNTKCLPRAPALCLRPRIKSKSTIRANL